MNATAFEWPHDAAAREKAACADPRDFAVSDDLVERTASLLGIERQDAAIALTLSVSYAGGVEGAEGFIRYGNPTDLQWRAWRRYSGALSRIQADERRAAA